MADNFQITEGSGIIIAAHENVDLSKEQKIQVTNFPASTEINNDIGNPIPCTIVNASVTIDGTISVNNFPASQPVTGTFFPATQPVSGPLTDTQLRATPVPVSGTVTATTGGLTDTQLRSTPVPVSGTVTATPSGTQTVSGTVSISGAVDPTAAVLAVTATGAAAAAVTATLPAVVGQFHYITMIEITKYATVAVVGSATPVIVTTTNLPGTPAMTFETAQTIGAAVERIYSPVRPLRSAVANTATTIVGPATASIIWRINVHYYTAA